MNNSILRNGLILFAFALATTAIIALTFAGTKETIEAQLVKKRLSILTAIIPDTLYDNDIHHQCVLVNDELLGTNEPHRAYLGRLQGQPSVMAIEATAPNGYSGKIELIVGVDTSGTVSGVRVLEHRETPGLGDKIELRVSDWILSFTGEQVTQENLDEWQVRKDGGQFDQFTGATITPRAVVNAVKNAVLFAKANQTSVFASNRSCDSLTKSDSLGGDKHNE